MISLVSTYNHYDTYASNILDLTYLNSFLEFGKFDTFFKVLKRKQWNVKKLWVWKFLSKLQTFKFFSFPPKRPKLLGKHQNSKLWVEDDNVRFNKIL